MKIDERVITNARGGKLKTPTLKELIDRYNVLACPKSGIQRLTPSGKFSKVGFVRHTVVKM